jgi:hypothetical protein
MALTFAASLLVVSAFTTLFTTAATSWQSTLQTAFPNGIVETFDNLQDWNVPDNLGVTGATSMDHPEWMPKTIDGANSHWNIFTGYVDRTRPPWVPLQGEQNIRSIANHGSQYSLWDGKSACLMYPNYAAYQTHKELDGYDRAVLYGPTRLGIYFGTPGDNTSGFSETYIFYRFKLAQDRRSLTGGTYAWVKSTHGAEEYYFSVGSPGVFCPNDITINNTRIDNLRVWRHWIGQYSSGNIVPCPVIDNGDGTVKLGVSFYPSSYSYGYLQPGDTVTVSGTANYNGTFTIVSVDSAAGSELHRTTAINITHSYVPETPPITAYAQVTLGSLGTDQWSYGDNDSLGYRTVYVRLSGVNSSARNPNNAAANYILYESDFWPREPRAYVGGYGDAGGWVYHGIPKQLMITGGFNNSRDYISQGWVAAHCPSFNSAADYGLNFHIFNLLGNNRNVYNIQLTDTVWVGKDLGAGAYYSVSPRNSAGSFFLPYSGDTPSGNATIYTMANATTTGAALYENGKWFNVEIRLNLGTQDGFDSAEEFWLYDDVGNVLAHNTPDPTYKNGQNLFQFLKLFQHKINKIEWGGNKIVDGYGMTRQTAWNNRWYLDDVIINRSRIGPTYFALVKGQMPPGPPANLRIGK